MTLSRFDSTALLVMDSSTMPTSMRVVLVCLVALLAVMLLVLLAFVLKWRRRSGQARPAAASSSRPRAPAGVAAPLSQPMVTSASARPALGSLEGVAVEPAGGPAQSCPTCRREFEGGLVFCPHDARRLVPAGATDSARAGGSVCPRCRRGFDPGVRFCPHDASELLPLSLHEATRGARALTASTGVRAKICPNCRQRFDLAATFCGVDGSELLTIN